LLRVDEGADLLRRVPAVLQHVVDGLGGPVGGDVARTHSVVRKRALLVEDADGSTVPLCRERQAAVGDALLEGGYVAGGCVNPSKQLVDDARILRACLPLHAPDAVEGVDELRREPCFDGADETCNSTSGHSGLVAGDSGGDAKLLDVVRDGVGDCVQGEL